MSKNQRGCMVIQEPEDDIGPDFKSRAMRDREDLNAEIAGANTGRQARFLVGDNAPIIVTERKKKEEERRFYFLLDMLLRDDPHYARLYTETRDKIERARQAVDLALLDIKQGLEVSDRKLQKMREEAGMLPDGTRVFRSSVDNGIYTESGQRLNAADSASASIPEGAASWEEYAAAQDAKRKLRESERDAQRYRDEVLKPAAERLNNKDDPPSMEELKEIGQHLDKQMPSSVRSHAIATSERKSESLSVAHTVAGATTLDAPDLKDHFDSVRVGANVPPQAAISRPAPVVIPT
jgi:hypothetical protein